MRVRVIKGFSGRTPDGQMIHYGEGDEFELPKWADWLEAGLVEVAEEVELAVIEAPEQAVRPRAKKKRL